MTELFYILIMLFGENGFSLLASALVILFALTLVGLIMTKPPTGHVEERQ